MSLCDGCEKESGNLYCGHCREKIKQKAYNKAPKETDKLLPLIYWDKEMDMYRFGCVVRECPANVDGICCTPALELLKTPLHEFDGDNCIKQVCG